MKRTLFHDRRVERLAAGLTGDRRANHQICGVGDDDLSCAFCESAGPAASRKMKKLNEGQRGRNAMATKLSRRYLELLSKYLQWRPRPIRIVVVILDFLQ